MRTAVALVAFFVATVTAQTVPYYITSPIQGTTYKAGQRYVLSTHIDIQLSDS